MQPQHNVSIFIIWRISFSYSHALPTHIGIKNKHIFSNEDTDRQTGRGNKKEKCWKACTLCKHSMCNKTLQIYQSHYLEAYRGCQGVAFLMEDWLGEVSRLFLVLQECSSLCCFLFRWGWAEQCDELFLLGSEWRCERSEMELEPALILVLLLVAGNVSIGFSRNYEIIRSFFS